MNFTRIALACSLRPWRRIRPRPGRRGKLKVGLMLPATGTFASLGTAIENGFRLYVAEQGGKLAGREIEFFKVDDETRSLQGRGQRQQAGQARQRRRAGGHRAQRRRHGDGQGGARDNKYSS